MKAVSGMAGIAVAARTELRVKSGAAPVTEVGIVRGCSFAVIAALGLGRHGKRWLREKLA